MKKLFGILTLVTVAFMVTSCGDDDPAYEASPVLGITSANLVFTPTGGTNTITTTATDELTANSTASWLTIEVDGKDVRITATRNTDLSTRAAVINLSAGGAKAMITAQQNGLIFDLHAADSYSYKATGNTVSTITNDSNVDFDITVSADWIHLEKSDEGYSLSVDDNESDELRTGTATLSFGESAKQMKIVQWGKVYPFLTMNTATYKDKDGNVQTKAVTIVANPSKEEQYLVQGLVPEGDLLLIPNTVDGYPEWYVPCGHLVGTKNNLEGKQVWLRCMMSCKNIESDNRYIPTVKSEEPTTSYRMSFGWNVEEDGTVILPYQRNANLAEIYATDGIIVCRYTKANKVAKSDRDGDGDACIEYYFLDLKFSKV